MQVHTIPCRLMKVNRFPNWLLVILILFWKRFVWFLHDEIATSIVWIDREKIEIVWWKMALSMKKQRWSKTLSHQESKNLFFSWDLSEMKIITSRATIIQPNRPSLGFVHQQNVYSPPVIRGTFSGRRERLIAKTFFSSHPLQWVI